MDPELEGWVTSAIQLLGPLGGLYVSARVVLGFQRSVVDTSMRRTEMMEDRLSAAERRLDQADERIRGLELEVLDCDHRNARLMRVMTEQGIEIPEDLKNWGRGNNVV